MSVAGYFFHEASPTEGHKTVGTGTGILRLELGSEPLRPPGVAALCIEGGHAMQSNGLESEAPMKGTHTNFMGGTGYSPENPIAVLRMAAASSFFGEPQYYQDGAEALKTAEGKHLDIQEYLGSVLGVSAPLAWQVLSPEKRMEKAIDDAIVFDAEGTLRLAVELRNDGLIRLTPQVIMVRAANHVAVRGTGLVRKYAHRILMRCDEPAEQLAYQRKAFPSVQRTPNALTKAWKTFLEGASEYALAKYRKGGRGVKLVDVINLCHAFSPAIDKLMKGSLKLENHTWESLVSEQGSSRESWSIALDQFLLAPQGHMALLRNLRNLHGHKLVDQRVLDALIDGVSTGKQLPFRYYSAYRVAEREGMPLSTLTTLEDCLKRSIAVMPRFAGKVMSLCDNSGSAWGAFTSDLGRMAVANIANLTGVVTAMMSDEGHVGAFGDRLHTTPISKEKSLFEQLNAFEEQGKTVGSGTENGVWLFFEGALRRKEHWDHVFIYSDMQAGHGGLFGTDQKEYSQFRWQSGRHIDVAKLIGTYHAQVNSACRFYLVQVAGYQDSIAPMHFRNTIVLGGWGPGLLRFAQALSHREDQWRYVAPGGRDPGPSSCDMDQKTEHGE